MPFANSVRSSFGPQSKFGKSGSSGDGLTPGTAGTSAYQIKQSTGTTTDGLYWISNSNINGGTAFQVYCDMNTNSGGWTLLVNSTSTGWTSSNVTSRNTSSPNVTTTPYSILNWGNYLKRSTTGFEYMLGASSSGYARSNWTTNGVICIVNSNYSFVSTSPNNTNITPTIFLPGTAGLPTSLYSSGDTVGIGYRMPWLGSASTQTTALLTTFSDSGSWWGTIIQDDTYRSAFNAGPWISAGLGAPNNIWYWVR